jgi:hypothetical protein
VKIVKVIACVVGFGVLGAGIGFPAGFYTLKVGTYIPLAHILMCMLVFGILGVALGGYVG